MLLSTKVRYGGVAIAIHWIAAAALVVALGTGFAADNAAASTAALPLMRAHIAAGALGAGLTLLRLVWWLAVDARPADIDTPSRLQRLLHRSVRILFYVVPIGMAASGIGMLALTGAGDIVAGIAPGPLPVFEEVLPRRPHGLGALLLLVLIVLHVAAALYHQIVLRDAVMDRLALRGRSR